MKLKCRWALTLVAALAFVVPAGVSAQPVASDEFRVTLLGTPAIPALTEKDVFEMTRKTYDGPLLIGEDLMAFRVEREQVVPLPPRTP